MGNFISGAGSVVGMVNPFLGAGMNLIGSAVNTTFGANINQAALDSAKSGIDSAKYNIGNSLTWDTLSDNMKDLNSIDINNIGTQGIFSHRVDDEREKLILGINDAIAAANFAKGNITTLEGRQMRGTAFKDGGKKSTRKYKDPSTARLFRQYLLSDIGNAWDNKQQFAKDLGAGLVDNLSSVFSPTALERVNQRNNAAIEGFQDFASAMRDQYNTYGYFDRRDYNPIEPAIITADQKRFGGPIFKTDYDMGLTFVNNGGTHEQNPYGGVFMGMAPDGQPNQVEEGEVIFNDYVYSNRLKVPKAVRNKYKLRETSFADAIEEYVKKNGIEERNNDPIANRGLEAFASELAMEQEIVKAKKEMRNSRQAAFGGHLFPNGGTAQYGNYTGDYSQAWGTYVMPGVEKYFTDALAEYNAATDDAARAAIRQRVMDQVNALQRSYAGISSSPLGTRNKSIGAHQTLFNAAGGNYGFNGNNESIPGIDALIERGYAGGTGDNAAGNFAPDDIYGWRTNLRHFGSDSPEDAAAMERIASMANQMNMNWGATLADPGHEGRNLYMLSAMENATTPVAATGPEGVNVGKFTIPQALVDAANNAAANLSSPSGTTETNSGSSGTDPEEEKSTYDPAYWWRMAGLGANAAGLLYNIFDPYRPKTVNEARYTTINPKYIGDYLIANPFDINYETSQQDANTAALRNALMQSTAPIRNGSLLAADFNANATRGAARRQALEYNDAMKKAVTEFNRGTNQFNAQMYVDAATKNQAAKQAYFQDKLRQAQFNSQLDFQHKMMRDQAIGQGLTSIADYLNAMAKQRDYTKMIQAEIDSGARDANAPMKDLLAYFMTGWSPYKACGGRLRKRTTKKK